MIHRKTLHQKGESLHQQPLQPLELIHRFCQRHIAVEKFNEETESHPSSSARNRNLREAVPAPCAPRDRHRAQTSDVGLSCPAHASIRWYPMMWWVHLAATEGLVVIERELCVENVSSAAVEMKEHLSMSKEVMYWSAGAPKLMKACLKYA